MPIQDIILEIMYFSLISVVPSSIAILIPLIGAYWIIKVREKNAAEGKIFEIGREIANILKSKEIRGPIDPISYAYIDKALNDIEETNKNKALKILLQKNLFPQTFNSENDFDQFEAAEIVVAIASERINSLVPPNVNWSGKGSIFSTFGEDINTEDNFFPFGTRLYRYWIEKFGDIYNDLWAITTFRSRFIDNFIKHSENKGNGVDKEFVESWLEEISNRINIILPLHGKLLTQLQIIDSQIDLPRFKKNIWLLSLYITLLSTSGFFAAKFIYLSDIFSLSYVILLIIATAFSYMVIGLRIASAINPVIKKSPIRKIFVPELINELTKMKARRMRYKPHKIKNIISLSSELKLNHSLKQDLNLLVTKIESFNRNAGKLFISIEELIKPIKSKFQTTQKNQCSFGVDIFSLPSEDYNLQSINKSIMKNNNNFIFSYHEIDSSRDLYVINMSELDEDKRKALIHSLSDLGAAIRHLPLYIDTMLTFEELQRSRKKILKRIEKIK